MKLAFLPYSSLLVLLFIMNSCGSFIKRVDEQGNNFVIRPHIENTYCTQPANPKYVLFNSSPQTQADFYRITKDKGYSSVEIFALWSLVQMSLRPDINSPESQFEVFVDGPVSIRYFRFTLESHQYPMLEGLSFILRTYSSKRTLRELITRLDNDFVLFMTVDKGLENFIFNNKSLINQISTMKESFIRADDPLQSGEKFKRMNFSKLLTLLPKTEQQNGGMPLLATENNQSELTCNFSMQSYEESLYSVQEKVNPTYTFGVIHESFSFLAASSLAYKGLETFPQTYWLKNAPDSRKARFDVGSCLYEDPVTKKKIALISTESRDPGQHLYHLFQYDMKKIRFPNDMDTLFKFSRHLFLTEPLRLIYESHRGTERQLTELLKLSIPIYNANQLGHITAIMHTPEAKTFILDNRHEGNLSCH